MSQKQPRSIGDMRRRPGLAMEVEHAESAGKTLRRLWGYFAGEHVMLLRIAAAVVAGTFCQLLGPAMQSRAIDSIAGTGSASLSKSVLLMLLFYILSSLCALGQGILSGKLSQRIVRTLRGELFGKIIDLPVSYLDRHSHGDVMSRMTNDVENVSQTVSQALPTLCSGALTIVGTALMMCLYSLPLALLSLSTVLLTVAITRRMSLVVRRTSRERQRILGALNGQAEELISGYRTVKAFGREEAAFSEMAGVSDELTKAGIRADVLSGIMGPAMNAVNNLGFIVIAAFGGDFAFTGRISVGVISAFIVYARQFGRPVNELAQVYGQIQTAIAAAERVFRVLDEEAEDQGGAELEKMEAAEVRFEHVDFSYVPDVPVLRDFSLSVAPGRKVALVGATGSGKTTVVNLLERFYDPDGGRILLNGQDLSGCSRRSLRSQMAIVLQETVLFSGTVRENLLYGCPERSEEEIRDALAMSCFDKVVQNLPRGLDTVLTPGGSLSAGERQLLVIARAFLQRPRVLILDEATSNVDTRTEKAIQDAMHELMQGRTSIIIAHRLSTIRNADLIAVLDHGQLVESGTHEQLLERKGRYRQLYETQLSGSST